MASKRTRSSLARLPSVDLLLQHPDVVELLRRCERSFVLSRLRRQLDSLREELRDGVSQSAVREELAERIVKSTVDDIQRLLQPSLRRAINATGVILHTGLGRAPLAAAARESVAAAIAAYCTLEIDLKTGLRGDRTGHVEELLCELTGAEAACVVNNNAAAVLLTLNTLALDREVIVSRGQLIEIGGSFRIPEVMERSGALMVEVGTTNKTHVQDFEGAITDRTAVLFMAHWSNYRILGFVEEVPAAQLVELGGQHGLPVVHDLGGGVLRDLRQWGLPYEPVVRRNIEAGVDLVTFSGDKVLGGPQSGIIVGKRDVVSKLRANPMMRALRCDKMTFAALEPTVKLFLQREAVPADHPVLRMLSEAEEGVRVRAERLCESLRSIGTEGVEFISAKTTSQTGSGALPLEELPSWAVTITSTRWPAEQLAAKLRGHEPPIVGYIREGRLHLDCRTLNDDEVGVVVAAIRSLH